MIRVRHTILALAALAVLALGAAPLAHAKGYHAVINDCYDDGQLQGHYTRHEIQQALHHLPSDINEYSDCADVLHRALLATLHRGGGGGGPGRLIPGNPKLATASGAQAASPKDLKDFNAQTRRPGHRAPPKVAIEGRDITAGAGGVFDAAARATHRLPTSLLLALAALAAIIALAGVLIVRHRWPETRRVALRLLRR